MSDPLRFFVNRALLQHDQLTLCDEPFHHLCHVLRVKAGAELLLLDGTGLCCLAKLEQVEKQHATARVLRRWQEPESALPITLMQALPKGDKFDLILQKGTELGVCTFQPVQTEHAVTTPKPERMAKRNQRWQRIINEAARQSRRTVLPQLQPLQPLAEVLIQETNHLKLVLWEAGFRPLAAALPEQKPAGVTLLIGPEGGFSTAEMTKITAAGFQAVHLGPRILRTETAGLAAPPVLQYLYGDWQQAPTNKNFNQHEEIL